MVLVGFATVPVAYFCAAVIIKATGNTTSIHYIAFEMCTAWTGRNIVAFVYELIEWFVCWVIYLLIRFRNYIGATAEVAYNRFNNYYRRM